eukprot:2249640-Pleurochrysis_carterae.AAC.1
MIGSCARCTALTALWARIVPLRAALALRDRPRSFLTLASRSHSSSDDRACLLHRPASLWDCNAHCAFVER